MLQISMSNVALGAEMLFRTQQLSGLTVLKKDPIPWLPNGSNPPLEFDSAQPKQRHCCEAHGVVILPLVLVVPVKFMNYGYPYLMDPFEPYWIRDSLVLHVGAAEPDPTIWRHGVLCEAICGVAQYHPQMGIGSLRVTARQAADIGWSQPSCQACAVNGSVEVLCGGSPLHHHRLFVRRNQGNTPPRTCRLAS